MSKKYDLIIFSGAPASGKSTISQMLFDYFNSVIIDFGKLREFHLDKKWKRSNEKETNMTFNNLVFIIKNYLKNGYKNIIVNDLRSDRVSKLSEIFSKNKVLIIRLIVDDKILTQRIKNEPNRGFNNISDAVKFNKQTKIRKITKNEIVIDNSNQTPQETFKLILKHLE